MSDDEQKVRISSLDENGKLQEVIVDAKDIHVGTILPEDQIIFDNYGMIVRHPVKFKRVHPDAILPKKSKEFDACWDLYSVEDVILSPMEIQPIDTGLQMEMPPYLEATIRPRSGLALQGLLPVLGTIDSGYRGNIKVIMMNVSQYTQPIEKGRRIAQMQFGLTQYVEFEEVDELNDSKRGAGGFGSTGDK